MRVLVAGDDWKGDWRLVWAALGALDAGVGPITVLAGPTKGSAVLAKKVARAMELALVELEEDWPAECQVNALLLFHASLQRDERLRRLLARANRSDARGHLVHSAADIRTIKDLITILQNRLIRWEPPRPAPPPPLTREDASEALRSRDPKWIIPLVAEVPRPSGW